MIPAYYDGLNPVMKELVRAIGLKLILPPLDVSYLGEHLQGTVWVKMMDHSWGGPEAVLLHEIGHWTGGAKHLARRAIVNDDRGIQDSQEERRHEEAIAQYTMMLLAPALGILTEGQAQRLFLQYVAWDWDVRSVTREAHRAFAYVRMLAPHLFGRKPVEVMAGPTNGSFEEAA